MREDGISFVQAMLSEAQRGYSIRKRVVKGERKYEAGDD